MHGLQGNGVTTWTHPEYDVFWPRDLLAKDIKHARILTWFYDSTVLKFWADTTANDIDANATSLCSDLASLRANSESEDRPIIFVAHSLGGLVCANALVLGSGHAEADVKKIASHTRGMIFLGTPHEGSDLAKWAALGLSFLRLEHGGKATRDLDVLQKESGKLRSLSTAFGMLLRSRGESKETEDKIEIVCFYEEFKTRVAKFDMGIVVPQASASLSGYEAVGIPENHRNMVRFKSKDDVGYIRISGYLKKWVKRFSTPQPVSRGEKKGDVHIGTMIGGQAIAEISGGETRFENNINLGEALVAAFIEKKKKQAGDD